MALFKKISFKVGMPAIILDFVLYITGGLLKPDLEELCQKAIRTFYERVPPKIVKNDVPKLFKMQLNKKSQLSSTFAEGLNAIIRTY